MYTFSHKGKVADEWSTGTKNRKIKKGTTNVNYFETKAEFRNRIWHVQKMDNRIYGPKDNIMFLEILNLS